MEQAIRALSLIVGDCAEIKLDPNWTRIWVDLNSRSKGKYIFLCYTTNASFGDPITEIKVKSGNNRSEAIFPVNYKVIEQDCNEGTKVHEKNVALRCFMWVN